MLKIIAVLFVGLFSFAVNASDQKAEYFAKQCLAELQSHLSYSNDNRQIDGKVYFKDFGPFQLKDDFMSDSLYCTLNQDKCNASYKLCLHYSTKRPWGEKENNYTDCFFDNNGNVINKTIYVGSRDKGRARTCIFSNNALR